MRVFIFSIGGKRDEEDRSRTVIEMLSSGSEVETALRAFRSAGPIREPAPMRAILCSGMRGVVDVEAGDGAWMELSATQLRWRRAIGRMIERTSALSSMRQIMFHTMAYS